MTATHVKRAFKFRFYPTDAQAAELSRTFGCVRLVYNKALAARSQAWTMRQERVNYNATGDVDRVEEDRGAGVPL
jgi:putative transposase